MAGDQDGGELMPARPQGGDEVKAVCPRQVVVDHQARPFREFVRGKELPVGTEGEDVESLDSKGELSELRTAGSSSTTSTVRLSATSAVGNAMVSAVHARNGRTANRSRLAGLCFDVTEKAKALVGLRFPRNPAG